MSEKSKKKKYFTKKNAVTTAKGLGIDLLVGSAGAAVGAGLGKWSPVLGILMMGAGHFIGGKLELLRVAGAATMAYGVAKAMENDAAAKATAVDGISLGSIAEGAKGRLLNFKDNWLKAFYLDKLVGKKEEESQEEKTPMGSIDLSDLDVFDDMNKQAAANFELQRIRAEEEEEDYEDEEDEEYEDEDFETEELLEEDLEEELQGLDYVLIDEDEIDFNTL